MLCASKKEPLTFVVPLKFLNIFFSHECYIPLRQVITVELVMQDDRNILIVKEGLANSVKYRLEVKETFLDKINTMYTFLDEIINLDMYLWPSKTPKTLEQ